MPAQLRRLLTVGAVMAALCMGNAAAHCSKTVRWSDDAPYSFKSPGGEISGFSPDLIRAALKGLNCEAKFVELPWARALRELEQGRLDILPGALRTPEREKFAYFSRPVNRSPNVLFVAKNAATKYRLTALADITGTAFRLGAQIGVAYGGDYDTLVKTPAFAAQITQITSRRSAWKMIEQERLDGIISDEVTALVELQQLGLSEAIVKTDIVVSGEPAMLALSQASLTPEFVKDLDRSLDAMMQDGRYKKIREQYIPCSALVTRLSCR
nr:transporter substrate-binding domain-containing protein [Rhodoferax sp.]